MQRLLNVTMLSHLNLQVLYRFMFQQSKLFNLCVLGYDILFDILCDVQSLNVEAHTLA
jgi:hypothetical protein